MRELHSFVEFLLAEDLVQIWPAIRCFLQVNDAKKDPPRSVNGQPYNLSVNLQGVRDTLCLRLIFVSEDDPEKFSPAFDLNKSKRTAFRRDDPTAAGTQFQRMIELPEGFKPGALP